MAMIKVKKPRSRSVDQSKDKDVSQQLLVKVKITYKRAKCYKYQIYMTKPQKELKKRKKK